VAISYTAREFLGEGSQINIRALRREDEADMLAAVERPAPNRCSVASSQ